MADEETIATILEALTKGIAGGIENKRRARKEEAEFALKKYEIDERSKDRQVSKETNDLYKQQMLGQRKAEFQVNSAQNQQKIGLQAGESARKSEADRVSEQTRAGDQLRKFQELKGKADKRLALITAELQNSPDDPQLNAQAKQIDAQSRSYADQMVVPTINQAGASHSVAPFLKQLIATPDEPSARAALNQFVKSGKFKPGSKELNVLLDHYRTRFKPQP